MTALYVPIYDCPLFAPLEQVPLTEGTPTFDDVAAALGVELWPLPEFSHEQFLRDHKHHGWLSWQLTRPLQVAPPVEAPKPRAAKKRPVAPKPKAKVPAPARCSRCGMFGHVLDDCPRDA